jgi:predicted transcriptional regulator
MKETEIPIENPTVRGREHIEAVKKLQRRAELVRTLSKEGLGRAEISQRTGLTGNTIRNYLSHDFSPVNAPYGKQREGKLALYRNEVLRLKADGSTYREIHATIKEKGYLGTQDAIRSLILKEKCIQRDLLSEGAGTEELIDKKWLFRLLYQPIEKRNGISEEHLNSYCPLIPNMRVF